jgi:predicted 3-demethylubiquinone-9 3-methyltransferase (glyoxalase superfamily)
MQKIVTFLTFNGQAEDALTLYTSVFKNAKVLSTTRYGDAGPGPKGTVMTATLELEGQQFILLNGGPSFKFEQGFSLLVNCETQAEVDELWEKLTADGGEPGQCGWLKDPFGVSWQIIPTALGRLMADKDRAKATRVIQAMLKMTKIDIAGLQAAYDHS